jgi:mannosyl-3-phosphoglycerate phosphatase
MGGGRATVTEHASKTSGGIVFTDLDGTLLSHSSYACGPARPALEAVAAHDIPVVFVSSKTRAEIVAIQDQLGVAGPFIAENGGAVFLTGRAELAGYFPERLGGLPAKSFGTPYADLRRALNDLRTACGVDLTGFGDVGVDEVVAWTGLPVDQVLLSRRREFDEPLVWRPEPDTTDVERVRAWLAGRDLRLTRGGRFWHLTGNNDKGLAASWLLEAATRAWGGRPASIALGDSENDVSLLAIADEAVLVARPDGTHLSPRPHWFRAVRGAGPDGWNRAVLDWLARIGR